MLGTVLACLSEDDKVIQSALDFQRRIAPGETLYVGILFSPSINKIMGIYQTINFLYDHFF